jgi:prevent-host-death family protein
MNKIVTASEANRSFSKLLGEVERGREVTVTNHGRVVARILPPTDEEKAKEEARRDRAWRNLMDHLDRQPAMNTGPWSREEAYDDDLK